MKKYNKPELVLEQFKLVDVMEGSVDELPPENAGFQNEQGGEWIEDWTKQ